MSVRNGNVWTPEKVNELINLYEANECLWNYNMEDYKNRMKRDETIRNVCNALHITKDQFIKKVHNLRNQFNFELKKHLKRNIGPDGVTNPIKWEYFDRLWFLRKYISHKAGYGSDLQSYKQKSPQHSEQTNMEPEEYLNTVESQQQEYESREDIQPERVDILVAEDHKYVEQSVESATPKAIASAYSTSVQTSVQHEVAKKQRLLPKPGYHQQQQSRDENDTFGEFVANELKNLNSDYSRKKMKRKIMQAMLEVWNDDDEVNINICLN